MARVNTAVQPLIAGLTLAALAVLVPGAAAQPYPVKPVRIIVPFGSGGPADINARLIAQKLSEATGQQFLVELRPGAAGGVGTESVAKAAPDGYTLLLANFSTMALNPAVSKVRRYDPVRDFAPVSMFASTPHLMVVHPSLPVRSLKEVTAFAKNRPGEVNYASSGVGGSGHMVMELYMLRSGVRLTHVPYKALGIAYTELMAGQVSAMWTTLSGVQAFVNAKRLRPIAVAAKQRMPAIPDVPTTAESGLDDFEVLNWFGIAAPAGTPPDIISRLNAGIERAVRAPDLRERFAALGLDSRPTTAAEFARHIRAESEVWQRVVKSRTISVD